MPRPQYKPDGANRQQPTSQQPPICYVFGIIRRPRLKEGVHRDKTKECCPDNRDERCAQGAGVRRPVTPLTHEDQGEPKR